MMLLKKTAKKIIIIIVLAFLVEILFFNFRHWESAGYEEKSLDIYDGIYGLEANGDGTFYVTENDAWLEYNSINTHIDNVYLDISGGVMNGNSGRALQIQFEKTDEASSIWMMLNQETEIFHGIEESYYKRLYLSGVSENFRIHLKNANETTLTIHQISLNKPVPFFLHIHRLLLIALIEVIFFLFNERSSIYKTALNLNSMLQKTVLFSVIALLAGFVIFFNISDRPWELTGTFQGIGSCFEDVADSLLEGKVTLAAKPPEWLSQLEDPYDYSMREMMVASTGEEYILDYSYYKGNYYSYYGVVPSVLLFIPFKMISGKQLRAWQAIMFTDILICFTVFYLLYVIIRKYRIDISLGLYIALSVFLFLGSMLSPEMRHNVANGLPMTFTVFLGYLGIALWMDSSRWAAFSRAKLLLGSFLIACIAGTRPQCILAAVMFIPIFWSSIKKRKLSDPNSWFNYICAIAPFLLVGCGIMAYNYVRFGSPFEFGQQYALANSNFTKGIFSVKWGMIGIFEFLFQPVNWKSKFPFLSYVSSGPEFLGNHSGYEDLIGGYFILNPLALCVLWIDCIRRNSGKEQRAILAVSGTAFALGLTLCLFDAEYCNVIGRFQTDFSWLLSLATVGLLLMAVPLLNKHQIILRMVLILLLFSLAFHVMYIFAETMFTNVAETNPLLFYHTKYLFWGL